MATKESTSPPDLLGQRELLKLVVQKLSSQVLLYGLAVLVFLVVAIQLNQSSSDKILLLGAILLVFLFSITGYLFFEKKRKIEEADPHTMNKLLTRQIDKVKKYQKTSPLKVWTTKLAATGRSRDIEITAKAPEQEFRLGDKIVVHFASEVEGYLSLFNIGTSGRMTRLYPNSLHPNNHIDAHREYSIPAADDNFQYLLQGPAGTEKLKAVLTTRPMELMKPELTASDGLFETRTATAAARDIAIIKETTQNMPEEEWFEAGWEFEVLPQNNEP